MNDVTCNKALSTKLGTGTVQLVADPSRGTVASFQNGYLEVGNNRTYVLFRVELPYITFSVNSITLFRTKLLLLLLLLLLPVFI